MADAHIRSGSGAIAEEQRQPSDGGPARPRRGSARAALRMRRWLGKIGRFARETEGAVMVEMAILTPILIALSAGVFAFGSVFYQKLLIEGGLDDAARYLARCHRVAEVTAGDNAVCDTNAKSIAVTGDSGTARVTDWTTSDIDIAYTQVPIVLDTTTGYQNYRSSASYIETVRVSTDYAYPADGIINGLLAVLGLGPVTLTAFHEERVLGW